MPKPNIQRIVLQDDSDCGACGNPLMFGEIAYRCLDTGATGCCQEHAQDAAHDQADAQDVQHFRACFEANEVTL